MQIREIHAQAVVVGAGAGGFGAAYTLAKNGIQTILIEKNSGFGGTAVFGGVNCWEPGVSRPGVHLQLAELLLSDPKKAGVGITVPNVNITRVVNGAKSGWDFDWEKHDFHKWPFGLSVIVPDDYSETLERARGFGRNHYNYRRLQFLPDAMENVMAECIKPYEKNLTCFFESQYTGCTVRDGVIRSVRFKNKNGEYSVNAEYFIDCTADIYLAKDAGCRFSDGAEGKIKYGEPCGGEENAMRLNGVTCAFAVEPCGQEDSDADQEVAETFENFDYGDWDGCISVLNVYPDNSINVNMLPTLTGEEFISLGERAETVARARVYRYWKHLHDNCGLEGYRLKRIFAFPAKREGSRLVGKYVLTENDIRAGFLEQPRRNEFIAYADHALDVHGEESMCTEVEVPYGIPLSCTCCAEAENLFVACRGASFSHVATSSARLTRTMLSIGEGVAEAVTQKIQNGTIDLDKLQQTLRIREYEEFLIERLRRSRAVK